MPASPFVSSRIPQDGPKKTIDRSQKASRSNQAYPAGLCGLRNAGALDRSQIYFEQGLVLLTLLLVLASQANDLSNDLYIEAVALGFLKDLPLSFRLAL